MAGQAICLGITHTELLLRRVAALRGPGSSVELFSGESSIWRYLAVVWSGIRIGKIRGFVRLLSNRASKMRGQAASPRIFEAQLVKANSQSPELRRTKPAAITRRAEMAIQKIRLGIGQPSSVLAGKFGGIWRMRHLAETFLLAKRGRKLELAVFFVKRGRRGRALV